MRRGLLNICKCAIVDAVGFRLLCSGAFQRSSRQIIAFENPRKLGLIDSLGKAVGKHAFQCNQAQARRWYSGTTLVLITRIFLILRRPSINQIQPKGKSLPSIFLINGLKSGKPRLTPTGSPSTSMIEVTAGSISNLSVAPKSSHSDAPAERSPTYPATLDCRYPKTNALLQQSSFDLLAES